MTALQKQAHEMIYMLPDDCVEVVIKVMEKMLPNVYVYNDTVMENPFLPKTEEELFKRIDLSLAQAKAGLGQDADEVIDELMKEFA